MQAHAPSPRALRGLSTLLALLLSVLFAQHATAQAQTDLTTPTNWRWRANAPVTDVQNDVNDGYRVVDLEIESASPFRVSATLVRNTGAYAKGWWWYYGLTASQVTSTLVSNNARAIDIEPYATSSGLRYAVVMIHNAGADYATSHGWQTGHSFSSAVAYRNANPGRRFLDIQPYMDGGVRRYAFIWVANGGNTYENGWGMLLNTDMTTVSNWLSSSGQRLIDLEVEDDTGNVSCLTVPADGKHWYWFTGMIFSEVGPLIDQYASRIIDLQRYRNTSGAYRYAVVVRPNANDLTVEAMAQQRSLLPIGASSGFLLRSFTGPTTTMASLLEGRSFEPASTLKTAHHFTAMQRVSLGFDSLDNSIVVNEGSIGSCPNGTAPVTRTLGASLRLMMESSSNADTEAIRARYGTSTILNTCGAFGATGIALNHMLGCLCGLPRNQMTLNDLSNLHESVVGGALGAERDHFYELMLNGDEFGMGIYSTGTVLDDELAASSLSATEKSLFRSRSAYAHKGGSYNCNWVTGLERHRSIGAYVSLPFRAGCATVDREYFIGSWVNDANSTAASESAVGAAITILYRDRVRAAIQSWEAASCTSYQVYCTSTANSTGTDADCYGSGSPYLTHGDLTLHGRFLPQNSFALLLWSEQSGFTPLAGGSQGNLCLGGSIVRFTNLIQNAGASGSVSLRPNLTHLPTNSGPSTVAQPGMPLHFQWWFRDVDAAGAATSNYTSGLRVTLI